MVFIGVECFSLSRDSRFARKFDLEKRHYGWIQQISIFSERNRFSTKRSKQWYERNRYSSCCHHVFSNIHSYEALERPKKDARLGFKLYCSFSKEKRYFQLNFKSIQTLIVGSISNPYHSYSTLWSSVRQYTFYRFRGHFEKVIFYILFFFFFWFCWNNIMGCSEAKNIQSSCVLFSSCLIASITSFQFSASVRFLGL